MMFMYAWYNKTSLNIVTVYFKNTCRTEGVIALLFPFYETLSSFHHFSTRLPKLKR